MLLFGNAFRFLHSKRANRVFPSALRIPRCARVTILAITAALAQFAVAWCSSQCPEIHRAGPRICANKDLRDHGWAVRPLRFVTPAVDAEERGGTAPGIAQYIAAGRGCPLIEGLGRIASAAPIKRVTALSPPPPTAPFRSADDARSVSSALSLRIRLATPNAATDHLQRLGAFVDSADAALSSVSDFLAAGRERVVAGDLGVDDILSAVDAAASVPRFNGQPALFEGVSLRMHASELDVRPIRTDELGAVIERGRTHRLGDLRSGGSLDARAHRSVALRSIEAAAGEIVGVQSRIADFRMFSLASAQREVLCTFRRLADTGPSSPLEAQALSRHVRETAVRPEALSDMHTAHVLALLR
jgi:hypothetical protein